VLSGESLAGFGTHATKAFHGAVLTEVRDLRICVVLNEPAGVDCSFACAKGMRALICLF